MSKSNPDAKTRIMLTDPPSQMREKVRTAVTDSQTEITYDPVGRPGVSNLLDILSGITERPPQSLVQDLKGRSMKELKSEVADALEPVLQNFQDRFARLRSDPAYLDSVQAQGRAKATERAEQTMVEVRKAVGLDYQ